jgi:hypothetical protein
LLGSFFSFWATGVLAREGLAFVALVSSKFRE